MGHAFLKSNGCIFSNQVNGYIGYYMIDIDSIKIYKNPITKQEIYDIWGTTLGRAKSRLDISKYDEYMKLLEEKGNL